MKRGTIFPLLLILALFFASVGSPSAQSDEFVFGMVLVGPQDDRGWSQAHYEGGLFVEENIEGARMLVFESLNIVDAPETTLRDVVEIFEHGSFNDPGGDQWKLVPNQGKLLADPAKARKWQVRDTKSKNDLGQHRAYQIEVPQTAGRDKYSTGDIWVTIYRGDSVQQGEDVGGDCTDAVLETVYATGPLDTANGNDIVLWVVARAHHEPRDKGEEFHHLPYHYEEFSITPRNFEVFRRQREVGGGGHKQKPSTRRRPR